MFHLILLLQSRAKRYTSEKMISMLKRDEILLLEFSMNVDLYLEKVLEEMQYVALALSILLGGGGGANKRK